MFHAVVWIDHHEARILEFDRTTQERKHVRSNLQNQLHHKSGEIGAGKATADRAYLQHVTEAVSDATEILVVGPGTAKLEFLRYLHSHAPDVERKVMAVESSDHPTDAQILAHAREYFRAADRMVAHR